MQKKHHFKKKYNKKLSLVLLCAVILIVAVGYVKYTNKQQPLSTPATESIKSSPDTEKTDDDKITDKEKKAVEDINLSEPGNILWIVNKARPLQPLDYTPNDLVYPNVPQRAPGTTTMRVSSQVATQMEQMFADAKAVGLSPMLSSGFRSYSFQTSLYNGYKNSWGQKEADRQSARPGHSEHQTGLTFDVCNQRNCILEEAFATTPLGKWIDTNAHKYGFIVRYPKGKEHITGYIYEPWHLRYLGIEVAMGVYDSGKTLEEYFGLPPAPDYL